MTSVLIRDKEKRDRARSGAGLVNVEAETGVLWPQAKECWQPSEAGQGEKGLSPEPSEGAPPC